MWGRARENIRALMNLPIRGNKISWRINKTLRPAEAVREYVDYLLSLCERHGVSTIAEHVEDEAHLESVKRLPIRYAQGYVFSPPLANVRSAKARH